MGLLAHRQVGTSIMIEVGARTARPFRSAPSPTNVKVTESDRQ